MATSSFDHLLDQLNDLDNDELEQIATQASRLRVSRSGKTLRVRPTPKDQCWIVSIRSQQDGYSSQ